MLSCAACGGQQGAAPSTQSKIQVEEDGTTEVLDLWKFGAKGATKSGGE